MKNRKFDDEGAPKTARSNFLPLIGFVFLVLLIEWAGHKWTFASVIDWYPTLNKPSWTPPSLVFAPVWTILYLMIALSGWLVWLKGKPSSLRRTSFIVYGGQLLANVLWSYFFFFLKSPLLGVIDLSLLLILIGTNITLFMRLHKPAGFLLIPYFLWSLYAFFLNLTIWDLNR